MISKSYPQYGMAILFHFTEEDKHSYFLFPFKPYGKRISFIKAF
jgi:hypothetical protein